MKAMELTIRIDGQKVVLKDEPIMFGDSWVYICPLNGIEEDEGKTIIENHIPDAWGWFDKLHDKDNYWKVISIEKP